MEIITDTGDITDTIPDTGDMAIAITDTGDIIAIGKRYVALNLT